jgi:CubicO group peptidase (beta-lactamase class C family)
MVHAVVPGIYHSQSCANTRSPVAGSSKYQKFNLSSKMGQFPITTLETIKTRIESACSDHDKGVPGAVVAVVGKEGRLLFSHAGGQRGHGSPEPMSTDSVFWIASCTKLITGIACLQLVEQGQLSMDDANEIERICPELKDVKVLQEDGKLIDRKRGITLRMLLSHTG